MTTSADIIHCRNTFTDRMAVATEAFGTEGHDRDIAREQASKLYVADLAALFERDYDAAGLHSPTAQNLTECRAIFDQHTAVTAAAFPDAPVKAVRVQAQVSESFQKYIGIVLGS